MFLFFFFLQSVIHLLNPSDSVQKVPHILLSVKLHTITVFYNWVGGGRQNILFFIDFELELNMPLFIVEWQPSSMMIVVFSEMCFIADDS